MVCSNRDKDMERDEIQKRNAKVEAYYRANYNKLVKKVSGRCDTPENAEDIVQNAFVNAITYWGSYDPRIKDFDTWFGVILNNALKRYMKDARRFGTTDEFDEELHEGVEMSHLGEELIKKVQGEIAKKNKSNQEVLSLYFVSGYKPADIVEVLDVPIKTVKQCVLRFKNEVSEKYGARL